MRLSCLHHHLAYDAAGERYWLAEQFGHRLLLLAEDGMRSPACPIPLHYPAGLAFCGSTLGLTSPWQGWAALFETRQNPESREAKLVTFALLTREQGLQTPREWRWQEESATWWLLDSTAGKLIRLSATQGQPNREMLDCPGLFPHSFLVAEDKFWILDQRGVFLLDHKGRCSPCLHLPHPGLSRFLGRSLSGLCLLDACSNRLLLVEDDCSSWWSALELPPFQALCLRDDGLAGLVSLQPKQRFQRLALPSAKPAFRLNGQDLQSALGRLEQPQLVQLGSLLAGAASGFPAFTQEGYLAMEELLARVKKGTPFLSAEEKANAARENEQEWQASIRHLLAELQNNSSALGRIAAKAAVLWVREQIQAELQPGSVMRLPINSAREVLETRLSLVTAQLCMALGPQDHSAKRPEVRLGVSPTEGESGSRTHKIVHSLAASLLMERQGEPLDFDPDRDRDPAPWLQAAAALGCPQRVTPLLGVLEPLCTEQPRSIGHALAEFYAQTDQYERASAALAGADRLVEWALAAASKMSKRTPVQPGHSRADSDQPMLNPRLAHEPFYHYWLGWLLLQLHRFGESAQELASQRRLSPQSGKVASLHALSLLLAGRQQEAALALERHPQAEIADLLRVLLLLLDQGAVKALALAEAKKSQPQMGILACLCARLAGMPKLALSRILEEDDRQPHWSMLLQADLCRLQLGESPDLISGEGIRVGLGQTAQKKLPPYAWTWWEGRRLYASSNQAFAAAITQWAAQESSLFAQNPTSSLLALHWRPVADLPLWW
jgi:hypothetical protein